MHLLSPNWAATSLRQGIEGTAPARLTAIAEALALICRISGIGIPSVNPARKYPVKVSPAAVVSTASPGTQADESFDLHLHK